MTLTRIDPFTQLACPACPSKFNSRKDAAKHVKQAHFDAHPLDTSVNGPHRKVTLYLDEEEPEAKDLLPIEEDAPLNPDVATPPDVPNVTLASTIIDPNVAAAPEGNATLKALESVGLSLTCSM
jgi:hypothetical protein